MTLSSTRCAPSFTDLDYIHANTRQWRPEITRLYKFVHTCVYVFAYL